jgi:hypothetical protein
MTFIKYENLKNNPMCYIAKNNEEQCIIYLLIFLVGK